MIGAIIYSEKLKHKNLEINKTIIVDVNLKFIDKRLVIASLLGKLLLEKEETQKVKTRI